MVTCNIEDLTSQACLSGFFGQTLVTSLAIELQLVKNLSGDTSTLDSLMLQACASGFVGKDPKVSKGIELQLLCNIFKGGDDPSVVTCVTISGAGTVEENGNYTLGGDPAHPDFYFNGVDRYVRFNEFFNIWQIGVFVDIDAFEDDYTNPHLIGGIWTTTQGIDPAPISTQC